MNSSDLLDSKRASSVLVGSAIAEYSVKHHTTEMAHKRWEGKGGAALLRRRLMSDLGKRVLGSVYPTIELKMKLGSKLQQKVIQSM